MADPGDHVLIAEAQLGDTEALSSLYTRYKDRIYGYFLKSIGDPQVAEDLTQDTFVQVLEALPNAEVGSFRPWLFGVARHIRADYFRYQKKAPILAQQLEDLDLVGEGLDEESVEAGEQINLILENLQGSHQAALKLRELEGLSVGELALKLYGEDTQITRHRVSALLYRARQAAQKIGERKRKSTLL